MDSLQLPRQFEREHDADRFSGEFRARAEPLWPDGERRVPRVDLHPALEAAIQGARSGGRIVRGLEGAETALAAQQRGLAVVDERTGVPRSPRVSRLLLLADDGSERFYRSVDGLLVRHAPRVLALRLPVEEDTFGARFFGPQQVARLLLVDHKDAVSRILGAVAGVWTPADS